MRRLLIPVACLLALVLPSVAGAAPSHDCKVGFRGVVTGVVNTDPRIGVTAGDELRGSFAYDPAVTTLEVGPGPAGDPLPGHPLTRLEFSVGTLSATLDAAFESFAVPGLFGEPVNAVGAFFRTPDGLALRGGNTINLAGRGSFVIGNSSDGGIVGTVLLKPHGRCR